jgi:alpha-ketoglutarate-dependent taurine dioxygenase
MMLPSWRAVPAPGTSIESRLAVPAQSFLRIYDCGDRSLEADAWVRAHRAELERELLAHGAILLRGFRGDRDTFARVADLISPTCIDYRGGNAPRSALPGNIFTSSELPAAVTLVQHHEMMFSLCWPMKLLFFCERPAARGGETPLCSGRWAMHKLPGRILEEFDYRGGITYIRNFRPDIPFKTLEDTFQTRDRDQIEALCRRDDMQFEWRTPTWLQTRQTRPAFRIHPVTGDRIFVATAHLWHRAAWVRQLPKFGPAYAVDDVLAADPMTLWMHATYADGTPIAEAVVGELYDFFEAEKVSLPWRARDIMILDNILVSHGRNAFEGDRLTLAALREPYAVAS